MVNYCFNYIRSLELEGEDLSSLIKNKINNSLQIIKNYNSKENNFILNLFPYFLNTENPMDRSNNFLNYDNTRLKDNIDYLLIPKLYNEELKKK